MDARKKKSVSIGLQSTEFTNQEKGKKTLLYFGQNDDNSLSETTALLKQNWHSNG